MGLRDKLRERLSNNTQSFYVEEWDETIYATPLSCGDTAKMQGKHPEFPFKLTSDAMVDLLLLKCLDAQGDKVFTLEDKPILLRQDMGSISTVVGMILGVTYTVEDAEKN